MPRGAFFGFSRFNEGLDGIVQGLQKGLQCFVLLENRAVEVSVWAFYRGPDLVFGFPLQEHATTTLSFQR